MSLPNVTVACLAELADDLRRRAAASAGPLAVQPMAAAGRVPPGHLLRTRHTIA